MLELLNNSNELANLSVNSKGLLSLAVIAFLPALVLAMTAFTRIFIVLSILRQAVGIVNAPSNQIVIGISLVLTYFVMSPVLTQLQLNSIHPYLEGKIQMSEAIQRGEQPLRDFMLKQTRDKDLQTFTALAKSSEAEPSYAVVMTAFITSELRQAFRIGFLIYLPFLIVDLLVSSVLMSMGMIMASPLAISLPFKLLLFVLADGWNLLFGSLISSFGVS